MHSAPPASATSTVERRIARYASPSAWADEVHAVWMVAVGPSIPKRPASRAARYWGHVRRARERGLPERVDVAADRRDHAKPGHDDAPATPGVRRGASSHHRPSAPAPG